MLNVVIDTNVFISAMLVPSGVPAQIIEKWSQGKFWLITSKSIIREIRAVFFYDRIRKRCPKSDEEINQIIDRIQEAGVETPEQLNLKIISDDPTDDKFIIAAVEGRADYIVSGDQHLLQLGAYNEIKIVSPKEFMEIFEDV